MAAEVWLVLVRVIVNLGHLYWVNNVHRKVAVVCRVLLSGDRCKVRVDILTNPVLCNLLCLKFYLVKDSIWCGTCQRQSN